MEWEKRWVDYARRLINDAAHLEACARRLGPEAAARMDAPDLRWPGYVGAGYRPGGLLLTATVHREFASGAPAMPTPDRDRFVEATRAWRDNAISDSAWLEVLRAFYLAGLTRHWAVGRLLRALQTRVGVQADAIAYVNAARCQIAERPPIARDAAIKKSVVRLCTADYPLTDVVGALHPAVIVVTKGTYDAAGAAIDTGVPVVAIDQRQLLLRAPLHTNGVVFPAGTRLAEWAPAVSALLA
jgi:hypothetical protein